MHRGNGGNMRIYVTLNYLKKKSNFRKIEKYEPKGKYLYIIIKLNI